MGVSALCAGIAACLDDSWRCGRISAIFVEVGDNCMLVLITYDVSTQSAAGKARLRKVAKECVNYGQRVQNSVFECILDASQALLLKARLTSLINEAEDSLRFYYLGNNYQTKVEHFGCKMSYDAEGTLMI